MPVGRTLAVRGIRPSPVGFIASSGAGPAYDAASTALFARMTTQPNTARKDAINNLIVAYKNAGVWTKMEALWVLAAADSQAAYLDWKGVDANNVTPAGAVVFQADRGASGAVDAAGVVLNSGYNPSAAGVLTVNTAHLSSFLLTPGAGANQDIYLGNIRWFVTGQDNTAGGRTGSSTTTVGPTGVGPHCILTSRTASTSSTTYRNAVAGTVNTQAAATAPGTTTQLIAGSGGAASGRQTAIAHIGVGLTDTEVTACYNAERAYLSAIGVTGI